MGVSVVTIHCMEWRLYWQWLKPATLSLSVSFLRSASCSRDEGGALKYEHAFSFFGHKNAKLNLQFCLLLNIEKLTTGVYPETDTCRSHFNRLVIYGILFNIYLPNYAKARVGEVVCFLVFSPPSSLTSSQVIHACWCPSQLFFFHFITFYCLKKSKFIKLLSLYLSVQHTLEKHHELN